MFCLLLSGCSKEEVLEKYNAVVEKVGEVQLTNDINLQGKRDYGEDYYTGTYQAEYKKFSDTEYLFGGTTIERAAGKQVELFCNLEITKGESFEVRPFQFLVKPVTDKIMEKCFKSVYEDINSEDFYFRYSYQRMNHKVPIKDILYFESNKRKIFIVTEQEILELYGKLNEIEETLKTCKISFLRVHQSFLVNYKHISGQSYDSVVMDNGQKISISEDRRKIISEQYCSMEDTFYVDE